MAVSISPCFNGFQFFDNDGLPLSGGKLFQYEAGSSTVEQTTYADSLGAIENANPIVLDSSGRLPTDLWLVDGQAYNLILTLPDGTTVLQGIDNVVGVVASNQIATSINIWNEITDTPTYVSGTTFLVPGNLTSEFAVSNRVQVEYPGPTYLYGTVDSVAFSSPNTQVVLVNDSTAQNNGMSKVFWSSNVTNGKTVDAGAVSYNVESRYTNPLTAGYQIKNLKTLVRNLTTQADSLTQVWTTTGVDTYVITPSPAFTSYTTGMVFVVKFANTNTGACTINVNGLGAKSLFQYSSALVKNNPIIIAGMISQIAYDGTDFIVLDQLPPAAPVGNPHGISVFTSNGTFTVPAGVTSIKVSVVGGGGGSGGGWSAPDQYWGSGGGGGAASAISYITTTPGTTYSVTIGAGGLGNASGINGGPGGTTTFGSGLAIAGGGQGGTSPTYAPGAGGAGGTTGNDNVFAGSPGGSGSYSQIPAGGLFGMGGIASLYSGAYGRGGAGGGNGLPGNAGSGTQGVCVVEW